MTSSNIFSDIESTNDLIETIEYFKRLLEETRVSIIIIIFEQLRN